MKKLMTSGSKISRFSKIFQIALLFLITFSTKSQSQKNSQSIEINAKKDRIEEERFITINGIEQWVTIKGNPSKPAILFLHGGPGSPISPYSHILYGPLEKDFIIIQWDQRGAGKTFGRIAPPELSPEYLKANPLTVDQISNDGIALTEYLAKYLGKQKITLFGTSWGSVLGVRMASKRPDLFNAYVGHSQVVNETDNEGKTYQKITDMAQKANDQQSLEILKTIGTPPYSQARNTGKFYRVIKKYERKNSIPAPDSWFVLAPAYNNDTDIKNSADGDDYSFVNFVGDSKLGVKPMTANIDNLRDYTEFKIPIYFIQGEEDILTPAESTKAYFEKIKAPSKKYIPLAKTAHGFNQAVLDTQYKLFREINN
ncbi:alpha/beta fold hydrolase [Flavobacterium sp. H122]|uniref:alpha/beta fold hydrolase n=1 Tax=Flavobacterium sp. H122 TaxID=2529860 RepID=UPI00145A206A|nr:alpha/beta hydrolase [Flavobacterium sp. H122]